MPRTTTLLAGIVVVSAITYKYREDIKNKTWVLQQQGTSSMESIDTGLEKEIETVQYSLHNSHKYIKQRLIPSVKANWNEQVTNATHGMIDTDIPSHISHFWDKYILGHSDRQ
ncbi:hypothetical protein BC941DRAFT_414704 [Chlamydoabsidia padenii]|nr:hypothetical protein BC941DRAFT_414704 [Chlamydoabsidia padenii]